MKMVFIWSFFIRAKGWNGTLVHSGKNVVKVRGKKFFVASYSL